MIEEGRGPEHRPDAPTLESVAKPEGGTTGRRRFLQHGLAGGSVALLASTQFARASGGCGYRNFSGYQSVGTGVGSASSSPAVYCQGRSPGYYKTHTNWSFSPYTTSTKFGDIFTPSPFPSNTTFLEVLESGGGGKTADARQFIAALLNAYGGGGVTNYPYKPSDILSIWTTYYSSTNPSLDDYANYFSHYLDTL